MGCLSHAPQTLSLPLLKGLARLLELLHEWFNMALGDKLMEHLRHWLDPASLMAQGQVAWKPGEHSRWVRWANGRRPAPGVGGAVQGVLCSACWRAPSWEAELAS